MQPNQSYAGMWVTDDNRVRHELLPNGRYVEARGQRERAYEGRYEVDGTHIEYWDDTGFTADGDFVDANTLHHGGMILPQARDALICERSSAMVVSDAIQYRFVLVFCSTCRRRSTEA